MQHGVSHHGTPIVTLIFGLGCAGSNSGQEELGAVTSWAGSGLFFIRLPDVSQRQVMLGNVGPKSDQGHKVVLNEERH